eukprot:1369243-Prymnesium_polylepis.1
MAAKITTGTTGKATAQSGSVVGTGCRCVPSRTRRARIHAIGDRASRRVSAVAKSFYFLEIVLGEASPCFLQSH